MSAVDLLVDVIDEIHEAEKVLEPGDTPDPTILKHYKNLWQLLLGISGTSFDSSNYDMFELTFKNSDEVFKGIAYFGSNINSDISNTDQAVGSVKDSNKNVSVLDSQTDENSQETSISFKLTMFNKIRYLLYSHESMVQELLDESNLIDVIIEHLKSDVLNISNSVRITSKTNNNTFNLCYMEAVDILVNDEELLSIPDMAKLMLQTFKADFNVAYFFNPNVILKFQNKIVDIIKRVFQKHEFVDIEIDNYYQYNPIFPILKPIYRNLALKTLNQQNSKNDNIEEAGETNEKKPLDSAMLVEILENVTKMELEDYVTETPVTLNLFSRILASYIKSLKDSGESDFDIENDLYIVLIKEVVMDWVDGSIDTKQFVSQLTDLSLVPTAKPYMYQNVRFPTLHMRMALYQVKEDLRIYEKYFTIWKDIAIQKQELYDASKEWEMNRKKAYFEVWRKKYQKASDLMYINVSSLSLIRKAFIFNKLKTKYDEIENREKDFKRLILRNKFMKMKEQYRNNQKMMIRADNIYCEKLKKRIWNKLMSSKLTKFPALQEKFILKRKSIYLLEWHSKTLKVKNDMVKADQFLKTSLMKKYFIKWDTTVKPILAHMRRVEKKADNYIYHKFFDKIKKSVALIRIENKLKYFLNKNLIKKTFLKLCQIKQVEDISRNHEKVKSLQLKKAHFQEWKTRLMLLQKAKKFEQKTLKDKYFKILKLKILESKFKDMQEKRIKANILKLWKLKILTIIFEQEKDISLVQNHLKKWRNKSMDLQQKLANCTSLFPQIITAIYFDSFKDKFKVIEALKLKADEFKSKRQIINDKSLLDRMFELVKQKSNSIKERDDELIKRVGQHQNNQSLKIIYKIKSRIKDMELLKEQADDTYKMNILVKYYNIWYDKFEHVMDINDILQSKLDSQNVELLTKCMSVFQLKLIKIRTSESNIKNFTDRWDKSRKLIFLKIWRLKLQNRKSPTPTARKGQNPNAEHATSIPDLNPYVDLAPKARGSPIFRPRLRSRMRSLITGDSSQYAIEERVDDDDTRSLLRTPFNEESSTLANFRTPMSYNSGLSNVLNNNDGTTFPSRSVERVRKRNLEIRMNLYSGLRKPIPLNNIVEETDNNSNTYSRAPLFGSFDQEIIDTSTPVRRS